MIAIQSVSLMLSVCLIFFLGRINNSYLWIFTAIYKLIWNHTNDLAVYLFHLLHSFSLQKLFAYLVDGKLFVTAYFN